MSRSENTAENRQLLRGQLFRYWWHQADKVGLPCVIMTRLHAASHATQGT